MPWLASFAGILGLGMLLVSLGAPRIPVAGASIGTALLAVALAALWRYRRQDERSALGLLAAGSFGGTLLGGAMVTLGDPHALTVVYATLFAATTVATVVWFVRQAILPDPLDNPLRARHGDAAVLELDGVQFVVGGPSEVGAGEEALVVVEAQNGWDTPRAFAVELVAERRVSLSSGHFAVPPVTRVVLPAGAYGVVELPIVAPHEAPGRHPILVRPSVEGEGGARIRRWRARTYERPVSPSFTLLAAFAGMAVWGGGIRLQVEVCGREPGRDKTATEGRAAVLSAPSEAELARVRAAFGRG